jgi:hypothetical protein
MEYRLRARRGLSAIEVIVAALIVAGVFVVIWGIFSHGMRNIQSTERTLESTRAAHILFELLHRDLARAWEVAIPKAALKASKIPYEDGDSVIFIDLKEYAFRKKERRLYISGHPFRLSLFDEVSFEIVRPGLVKFTIAPNATTVPNADLQKRLHSGQFRLEGQVCVERLRALAQYPTQVEELKGSHKYCLGGWPLDY